jgi:membrane associated rhomboid family serine protease
MSATLEKVMGRSARTSRTPAQASRRWQTQREGIGLLLGIVALMWLVEGIDAIDGYRLNHDGIYSRSFSHLWGILTAPFIHANFAPHLLDNTIPLLFMGLIIALRGARRVALVTVIVIILGGLGTWLIGPAHTSAGQPISTIGASGVVFGYATYLLTRGFFDRSLLELLTGLVVGVVWGGALLSSLVPHTGVSWQGHLCGGIAGVVAAYVLSRQDAKHQRKPALTRASTAGAVSKG